MIKFITWFNKCFDFVINNKNETILNRLDSFITYKRLRKAKVDYNDDMGLYDLADYFKDIYFNLNEIVLLFNYPRLTSICTVTEKQSKISSELEELSSVVNYYTIRFNVFGIKSVIEFNDKSREISFNNDDGIVLQNHTFNDFSDKEMLKAKEDILKANIIYFMNNVIEEYKYLPKRLLKHKGIFITSMKIAEINITPSIADNNQSASIDTNRTSHAMVSTNTYADSIIISGRLLMDNDNMNPSYNFSCKILVYYTLSKRNMDPSVYLYGIISDKLLDPFNNNKGKLYDFIYNTVIDMNNIGVDINA